MKIVNLKTFRALPENTLINPKTGKAEWREKQPESKPRERMVQRLERAENVCRELRHQVTRKADEGMDWQQIMAHLMKWMRVAPKTKYQRPKPLNH